MITAHITLAVALALVFVPLDLAKIAAVPFMRRAAVHLGMTTGLYRIVGTWRWPEPSACCSDRPRPRSVWLPRRGWRC
ncbi:hypothetical protein SRB17_85390 [Streptomyces sp. RB17]|uniref:hypothetical protein n=1 Tax=Streptomyces sp. RB17 TaxID=2585197 RepID=UPI00130A4EC0|nr:hypothetical protein [Streptomyces sp. RB17]MQY40506.1 hypothetical protein [Streptomyces sp. RB17]